MYLNEFRILRDYKIKNEGGCDDLYIVNQNDNQTIELHSVRYSCRWSSKYEEVKKENAKYAQYEIYDLSNPFQQSDPYKFIECQCELWKQEHPYEEIVDIYVNGDQKFGMFYSRQRGIEEYKNILKALESGVVVYRIPEINESERNNGK